MLEALSITIIVLLVITDQLLKIIIDLWLKPIGSHALINNFIQLRYIENRGAAFGMLQNARWFFILFSLIIIAVGLYLMFAKKIKSKFVHISAILVIAGGIGNMIDRVFRGYVIDYIEPLFVNFAIFNFADCLVTVGAFMLIGYLIYDMITDSKKNGKADTKVGE